MLTFKNKEEEEFWKQVFLLYFLQVGARAAGDIADRCLAQLRERQPVQQFPEIEK